MSRWSEPQGGDIVWCRFPEAQVPGPGPKPRPALILAVYDEDAPRFAVQVAYGTSQKLDRLFSGEFLVDPSKNPAAYRLAGLSYPTKFDLANRHVLPYTEEWFAVAPGAPHGQSPRLGLLHASLMPAVRAAWNVARKRSGSS